MNTNNIVMVGNTAKQCRLGQFQDSDFAGDLEDSKSTSGGQVDGVCQKQAAADSRGSRTCVCANTLLVDGEGRMN